MEVYVFVFVLFCVHPQFNLRCLTNETLIYYYDEELFGAPVCVSSWLSLRLSLRLPVVKDIVGEEAEKKTVS